MPINIKIFEDWRIRSDSNNIILVRNENEREVVEGYYGSIESAMESFIEKKIKGFNSNTMVGLLNALRLLQTALNQSLTPLKLRVVSVDEGGKG